MALAGSALGMAVGVGLGLPATPVQLGLSGYNSVLAVLCVGGVFLRPSPGGLCLTVIAGVMAALLNAALASLLAPIGLPALTFPAAGTCITFTLFATRAWPTHLVPLTNVGVPEAAAAAVAAAAAAANAAADVAAGDAPLVRRPRRLSKLRTHETHMWQPPLALDAVRPVHIGNSGNDGRDNAYTSGGANGVGHARQSRSLVNGGGGSRAGPSESETESVASAAGSIIDFYIEDGIRVEPAVESHVRVFTL